MPVDRTRPAASGTRPPASGKHRNTTRQAAAPVTRRNPANSPPPRDRRAVRPAEVKARERRKADRMRRRTEWIESFFQAGVLAFILFFFLWPTKIDGASMQDTFFTGDRVIMSRVMAYIRRLNRNDIIICKASDQTNNKDIIKRIIGIPGDRIAIVDGQVHINGVVLHEPYAKGFTSGNIDLVLEKDEYFVLGDNRETSNDSRQIGPISKSGILGKVVFRYYPLTRLKFY